MNDNVIYYDKLRIFRDREGKIVQTDTVGSCQFQLQANAVPLKSVNMRNVFSRNHVITVTVSFEQKARMGLKCTTQQTRE